MPNNNSLTKADLDALEQRLQQLQAYIDERTYDAETQLLRVFSKYQQAQATRYTRMKADLGNPPCGELV